MKNHLLMILTLFAISYFSSCKKKEVNNEIYTIKAHLYRGIYKTPFRKENVSIIIFSYDKSFDKVMPKQLGVVQTDYFGYIEFSYKHFKGAEYIKLYVDRSKNFRDDKYNIEANKNISIELHGE